MKNNIATNLTIDTWFPIAIGTARCPFIKEIKNDYKEAIKNYSYDENGFCNKQVYEDPQFNKLNNWILQNVNIYAKAHLYTDPYDCTDSWVLDYPIGKGQPYHAHLGSTISCVFYLDADPDDAPIIFMNSNVDIKNPLNLNVRNKENIEHNELTYSKCQYTCESGKLVIFRSYMLHAVAPKIKKGKRIVFSNNFDKNKK